MIAVKICGLTDERAVNAVNAAAAAYAGFVYFPPSPRHIPLERAAQLKALLKQARSVSVLVDPDDALLAQAQSVLTPDYLQLHGRETPQRLRDIRAAFPGVKIIKAVAIRSGDDVAQAMRYADTVDMLMFDAKPSDAGETFLPGGNGLSFDWALLKDREFPLPWFLSGGLTPINVAEAIRMTGAKIVDVSSGVESSAGVKDPALIEAFARAARRP